MNFLKYSHKYKWAERVVAGMHYRAEYNEAEITTCKHGKDLIWKGAKGML